MKQEKKDNAEKIKLDRMMNDNYDLKVRILRVRGCSGANEDQTTLFIDVDLQWLFKNYKHKMESDSW